MITSEASGSGSLPQGKSSGSGRLLRLAKSIRLFLAIVKIQVDAAALVGSNKYALCHTATIVS